MFQVISVLPFSAKNAFVTAYRLESPLARFKNVVCCFSKRKANRSPQPLVYFLPYEREQEVPKCIHPKHSELAPLKLVLECRDKRNSNIAADTST